MRRYGGAGYFENVPGVFVDSPRATSRTWTPLSERCCAKSDPLSGFLIDSGLTNNVDAAHPANGDPAHLESLLVTNLNRIISGPSLYDSNRFQGIHLRLETGELLRQNPRGQDLIRLNRRLLEDAYHAELGTNDPPPDPYPPVTIISARLEPTVDPDKAGIMTGLYELRPGVFFELYVQSNIWSAYLQHRASRNGASE